MLGDGAGANEQVLCQPLYRGYQRRRQHQPAQAPAGHVEIFAEAVDADDLVTQAIGQAQGAVAVGIVKAQAQVNFVHQRHTAALAHQAGNALQLFAGNGCAGGVGRRGQQHTARGWAPGRLHLRCAELKALGRARRQQHRRALSGLHKLAVAGVARVGHQHLVAGLDEREASQLQGRRSTRRDDDAGRVDVQPKAGGVPAADGFAQSGQARGRGVLAAAVANGAFGSLLHLGRGREVRLADVEVQHGPVARLCGCGHGRSCFGQLHDVKRFDALRPLGNPHGCALPVKRHRLQQAARQQRMLRLCALGFWRVRRPLPPGATARPAGAARRSHTCGRRCHRTTWPVQCTR